MGIPTEVFYLSANPNKIKTGATDWTEIDVFYLSANPNKIKTQKKLFQ